MKKPLCLALCSVFLLAALAGGSNKGTAEDPGYVLSLIQISEATRPY